MTRLQCLSFLLIITSSTLTAQNLSDALRYSQLTTGGSARVMGVGGAFGAMGGDFGVTSLNVSGLADYRSSEVIATISYNQAGTTTTLRANESVVGPKDNSNETILENLAYIKHVDPYYNDNLITSNFALGLQQYSNYNQVFSYDVDNQGSMTERFANLANTDNFGDFDAALADAVGAIFYDSFTDSYVTDLNGSEIINKNQTVERSGRVNEFLVSWAGKYKGGLRIGVGLGVPFVNFEENKFYEENDIDNSPEGFNKLNYNENLTTSGTGWNLKLGVGYAINDKIRLGLGFQSPSWYRLDDFYSTSLVYNCGDCYEDNDLRRSPDGEFSYKLKTPMKATGSIGYLIITDNVKGFINVDAQYIDYTQNAFNFTYNNDDPGEAAYESQVNGEIETSLKSVINYNIGGELAYKKTRLRAGVSLQASPYFVDSNYDKILSTGLGYRMEHVFFDFAYQNRSFTEGYAPYTAPQESRTLGLNNGTDVHKLVFTLGIKI